METVLLYEAKVSEVPVARGQESIERYRMAALPRRVANSDEFVPAELVEHVRLPIERFHINGRDILAAFGEELAELMLCSDEATQAKLSRIPGLEESAYQWQIRARHLETELYRYQTFWRRLRNLFRNPAQPPAGDTRRNQ